MPKRIIIVWKWLARGGPNRKWRELSWAMTEEQAAAWAKAHGCDIEKIEGSEERRTNVYGGAGCYGESVPNSY